MALLMGREIDQSCPWMGNCWANQGCADGPCPDTTRDMLERIAAMEHECELLTNGDHTDPDLQAVCRLKHRRPQQVRWHDNGGGR